jgi:putative pyrroloquinoline-quinone binding quinoprotein
MNRRKFSATVLRLALVGATALSPCLARAGSAQETRPAPPPQPSKVFQEARAVNAPAAFEFEMEGFVYHIRQNGNGRRTKKTKTRGFNLRLDSGDSIGRLFYSEFEGDLLLLLHISGVGGGAGLVTRVEQPSMRGLWRQRIAAPDVGQPLRDDGHLYVTGKGLVGKLNLRTGEYLWRHEGLEDMRGAEPKPLNSFDKPELKGDAVLFREQPVYNPRRTLVLDKKSGKIIRVE